MQDSCVEVLEIGNAEGEDDEGEADLNLSQSVLSIPREKRDASNVQIMVLDQEIAALQEGSSVRLSVWSSVSQLPAPSYPRDYTHRIKQVL